MALAYLIDPQLQISDLGGSLNVNGFFRVYINGTDDRAVTYRDFNGTLNEADIRLDGNGRAVVIADSSMTYRVEVYNRLGGLLWTQYPMTTLAGGGGGTPAFTVESTDGSINVDKYTSDGVLHYDLSAESIEPLQFTRTDSFRTYELDDGIYLAPVHQAEGNMDVSNDGILLNGGMHYNVSVYIDIEAPSTAVNRFDGLQFRLGGPNAPVAEYTFDNSYSHKQVACISCDIHPSVDTRFRIYVENLANGAVLSCNQCTVHSLAAGYVLPGGGGQITVDQNYNPESANAQAGTAVAQAVAGKQDTISDLSDIRSGAALGATAVQPATLNDYVTTSALATTLADYVTDTELGTILEGYATTTALSNGLAGKQDTISDLSDIRSGAALGATAVQPAALNDYATTSSMNTALAGKQDVISDLSAIRSGASAGATAVQPGDLATVATTGDYDDLIDKPDLSVYATTSAMNTALAGKQDVISDLSTIRSGAEAGATAVQPADLATVATTGDYDDLTDKPDLSVYATTQAMNTALAGKQDTINDLATIRSGAAAGATALQPADVATVATTGDYDDLINKPDLTDYVTDTELSTILEGYQTALAAGSNIQISNGTISATDTTYTAGTGLDLTGTEFSVDTTTIATKGDLEAYTPTASLAAVALSNDYDDLDNKPTIPTLPDTKNLVAGSNITLTEGQDSVTISATSATYTAGTGISINNGVIANTAPNVKSDWNAASGSDAEILNKPTIPTLPATKNLVAGNNLSITDGQDSVTLNVTGIPTIGTVEV